MRCAWGVLKERLICRNAGTMLVSRQRQRNVGFANKCALHRLTLSSRWYCLHMANLNFLCNQWDLFF
ncbi:unnamed protein product [Ceutorhynchus assimilis]|uniref:Uncharacterized protein n=1 Tax=Ceutorhynchus assimilis TaxID=467358 RepID=A0A9N9MNE0_9CUCU|nr:unnamed protein product [Ceutorhynchus assimilis]